MELPPDPSAIRYEQRTRIAPTSSRMLLTWPETIDSGRPDSPLQNERRTCQFKIKIRQGFRPVHSGRVGHGVPSHLSRSVRFNLRHTLFRWPIPNSPSHPKSILNRQNSIAKQNGFFADSFLMEDQTPKSAGASTTPRKVGRPPAKHSSPDYAQVTVYVPKAVRNAVKIRLFQEGRELSALVEKLLRTWLDTNNEGTW